MITVRLGQISAILDDGEWSCDHEPTLRVLRVFGRIADVGPPQGEPDFALARAVQRQLPSLVIVSDTGSSPARRRRTRRLLIPRLCPDSRAS